MKPIKSLNHVGIAVRSIDAQRNFYKKELGAQFECIEDVPSQKVRVAFFRINDVRLELLEPTDPASSVQGFLDKRGEGHTEQEFNQTKEWRAVPNSLDLNALMASLDERLAPINSIETLFEWTDLMLTDEDTRLPILCSQLIHFKVEPELCSQISYRWQSECHTSIQRFASYAYHCIRCQTLACLGIIYEQLKRRSTNIIDVEYLYYTPFAMVFCSDDEFHKKLGPGVIDADQSFVSGFEVKTALTELAEKRKTDPDVQPESGSLIDRLFAKHARRSPSAKPKQLSPEEIERASKLGKEIMEKIQRVQRQRRSGGN